MSYELCLWYSFPQECPHHTRATLGWTVTSLAVGIRGVPADGWAVGPPASRQWVQVDAECAASVFIPFLRPTLGPLNPSMNPVLMINLGSVCVPITKEYSGSFPSWLFCLLLPHIVIFELAQTCIPHFLSPVPVRLRCQLDPHNWASEPPGHSLSWQGSGQPTQYSDSSHDVPGKSTLWHHPKVLPSRWGRPPWVLPLPVQDLPIKLQLSCVAPHHLSCFMSKPCYL